MFLPFICFSLFPGLFPPRLAGVIRPTSSAGTMPWMNEVGVGIRALGPGPDFVVPIDEP